MASKRPSMRGMGADTFFEAPANQHDSKSAEQETSNTVEQETSNTVEQQESLTAKKVAAIPANQQGAKTVNQPSGNTADDELMKATFYLTSAHILKLERIRLRRKEKGIKVDKSALVREAIDLLME